MATVRVDLIAQRSRRNRRKCQLESDGTLSPIRFKVKAGRVEKKSCHSCNRMTIMSSDFIKKGTHDHSLLLCSL